MSARQFANKNDMPAKPVAKPVAEEPKPKRKARKAKSEE